jgi:hypothetical protein
MRLFLFRMYQGEYKKDDDMTGKYIEMQME